MTSSKRDQITKRKRRKQREPAARRFIPDWLKISGVIVVSMLAVVFAVWAIMSNSVSETTRIINDHVNTRLSGTEDAVDGLRGDVTGLRDDVAGLRSDMTEVKTDMSTLKSDVEELTKIHPAQHASAAKSVRTSHDPGTAPWP